MTSTSPRITEPLHRARDLPDQPNPTLKREAPANICEQCDNYIPDPDQRNVLADQLADVIALRGDAEQRDWTSEAVRHQHVADAITGHLRTIDNQPRSTPAS